ncbi:hypothetical protein [Serratia proteamaculans]
MNKPHIKIHWPRKFFTCMSIERLPGEKCFITGEGESPVLAFKDWCESAENFKTMCKKKEETNESYEHQVLEN